MKKIITIAAIVLTFAVSSAFAKTEGNYFGMDVLRNNVKVKTTSTSASDNIDNAAQYYNHSKKNSSYGFGINYKYAFNFNNFFVAPGISYEFLNNEIKAGYTYSNTDYASQSIKLKNSISLRTNFGYDINDQFAFYVPVGVSQFYYDIKTADVFIGNSIVAKKSGSKSAAFIGLGFSYEPVKNWVMNLEYNKYQNLKLTSGTATLSDGQIRAKTNIDVMKMGLSYRF